MTGTTRHGRRAVCPQCGRVVSLTSFLKRSRHKYQDRDEWCPGSNRRHRTSKHDTPDGS